MWYKIYSFFRWDLWHFFSNIWKFRRELWNHNWWDSHFTLEMLYRSIYIMEKGMHNGNEIESSRNKKIQKMQRVLEILKHQIDDTYVDLAEKELGVDFNYDGWEFIESDKIDKNGEPLYEIIDTLDKPNQEQNSIIISKSREIDESEWSELWEILKGQDIQSLNNIVQTKKSNITFNEWFDGSGLKSWWQ
jgi:hypothetical protein